MHDRVGGVRVEPDFKGFQSRFQQFEVVQFRLTQVTNQIWGTGFRILRSPVVGCILLVILLISTRFKNQIRNLPLWSSVELRRSTMTLLIHS